MEFKRKLTPDEIKKLSREEDKAYILWLREQNNIKQKEERKNWTFKDYCEQEFTMNNYTAARRDHFLEEERIEEKVSKRLVDNDKERFTFFWETESPFSQWHKSKFIAPVYFWPKKEFTNQLVKNGYPEEVEFTSAEQFMMYTKAMLFMDLETASEILRTKNVRKIKELGRQVKPFIENTWNVYRWNVVYMANKYKFTQNKILKQALLNTKGTTLVEASPYDKVWGIGLGEKDPQALNRSNWRGQNLLGEILTELRIELSSEY